MKCFRDRVALVTGAASGIGRSIALRLAVHGARVIACDIDADGLARLEDDAIVTTVLDVRDRVAFGKVAEQAASRFGRIDYLFNIAGIAVFGEIYAIDPGAWRRAFDVNFDGTVNGIAAVYPSMLRARTGHIVNMASVAGLLPFPLLAPYAATKFAVVGLTECLRLEAEAQGIRVTLVCPGFVDTPIYRNAEKFPGLRGNPADLVPFRKLDVEVAASRILDAVARRRARVIFPALLRWCWRLYRLHPAIITLAARYLLARARSKLAQGGRP